MPKISLDYQELKSRAKKEPTENDKVVKIIVAVDETTGCKMSYRVESKGVQDTWIIKRLVKDFEELGRRDIILKTDNVMYRKEKYYSATTGKTYTAELPRGYKGEFGPNVQTLILSLYYGGNMTQGKLLEFLGDIDVLTSAGYISNLLIKDKEQFAAEKNAVQVAGLESSPWQYFDQTEAIAYSNHRTSSAKYCGTGDHVCRSHDE